MLNVTSCLSVCLCVLPHRNGKYFKVEVKDRKGRLISARQLKEKLQYVVNLAGDDVDERYIAALTAQDRPTWARVGTTPKHWYHAH